MMRLSSGFYYKTESISEYTDGLASDIPSVSYDITEKLGDKLEYWIRRFTPRDSGRLRDSIDAGPVMIGRIDSKIIGKRGRHRKNVLFQDYHVEVSTDVSYAPWVEYDTGKYGPNGPYEIKPIPPNRVLTFVGKDGKLVHVAKVNNHPGSPGAGMFRRGSERLTDTYIVNQSRPILSKFRARHLVARPVT